MADYVAGNIVDFIRGFGQRKREARVNNELKNYLNDPQATVAAVMQDDPRFAIQLNDKRMADEAAATAARRSSADANLGTVSKFLRGLPEDADIGAEFDSLAPFLTSAYGMTPESLATMRGAVTRPGALAGMDDKAFEAMVKDRYTTNVATPGAHVLRGGKVIDRVPFAARTVNTAPGNVTSVFDPNPGGGFVTDGQPVGEPAAPSLEQGFDQVFAPKPAAPKTGGRPVPQRATGQMVEQMVGRLFPAAVMTSGMRSEEHNRKVGGDPDSYHLERRGGIARDYTPPPGVGMGEFHAQLKSQFGPGWDVINEGDHVHIEPSPQYARYAGGGGGGAEPARAAPAQPGGPVVTRTGVVNPPKPTKTFRTATAEELTGYPPGTMAQVGDDGKLVNIKYPPAPKSGGGKEADRARLMKTTYDEIGDSLGAVDRLLSHPGLNSSVGLIEGNLPGFVLGQDAQNFINELDTFKNSEVLNRILAMKSGGSSGLGPNPSNQDAARLEKAIGVLQRTSDEKTIRRALRDAKTILMRRRKDLEASLSNGGGAGGRPTIVDANGNRKVLSADGTRWEDMN